MKQVTIYCSSSSKIDPKYNAAARELVRALHALGYGIISGGGARGTMGAITDESVLVGGQHVAVLPRFMDGLENTEITRVIWTDTMSTRKEFMRADTCAAIALPGGIGTLDELIETLVLVKLKRYNGQIIALNIDGYYEPLKTLLDHYVANHMMEPEDRDLMKFPNTVEELIAILK
ncbi:MAG: TIGR00730 family Rossman fold protein [Bacteroidales bacterium]|jgi:uncharacterized protein (TIGR00730 family)|nr:TIGR00730 family Rossman fold protein [Bacteroidales bacterium]